MDILMNLIDSNPVLFKISNNALNEIKRLMDSLNINPDMGLRLGTKGGGCAGHNFLIGFDRKKENDKVYLINDIPVFIQLNAIMFLAGLEIDFEKDEFSQGFSFNNPSIPSNAK